MIPSSYPVRIMASAMAFGLVGTVLATTLPGTTIEIAGGTAGGQASLGSSFANMAVGALPSAPSQTSAAPPLAEAIEVQPQSHATPRTAQPIAPNPVAHTQPTPPLRMAAANTLPSPAAHATPQQMPQNSAPTAVSAPLPAAIATTRAQAPIAQAVTAPPKTIPSQDATPSDAAPLEMAPPRARPTRLTHQPPRAQPDPQPQSAPASAAGDAQRNATIGTDTGDAVAPSAQQGQTDTATQQAGNAAVSNYPGQVMAQISRAPRPRVRARGTATVAFRVSANGAISTSSIARSSGSRDLDREALRLVQGAGPFAPPPAGAQVNFTVLVAGR